MYVLHKYRHISNLHNYTEAVIYHAIVCCMSSNTKGDTELAVVWSIQPWDAQVYGRVGSLCDF